jgi:hypothetical protein
MMEQLGMYPGVQYASDTPGYAQGGLVPPPGMAMPPQAQQQAPMPPQGGGFDMGQEASRVTQGNPQVVEQIKGVIMHALQIGAITMEQLNMAIEMAKAAAADPSLYPRLRELAIQQGLVQPDEIPEEYDQGIVFAMLLAAEAVEEIMDDQGGGEDEQEPTPPPPGPGMARGGLVPKGGYDPAGTADNIPIRVSGGEYVVPHHVVLAKGSDFFDRLIAKQNEKENPQQ